MRIGLRNMLFATAAAIGMAGTAHATVTYSVSGVAVSTGGMLTGSFTTNDARTSIVSFDITTPMSNTFSAAEYTPTNASITAATLPTRYFRLDTPGNGRELQFYFESGLSSSGGTLLSSNSYENQSSGGNRFLTGSVTVASAPPLSSVPEPTSLLVIGGSMIAYFGLNRRRSSATPVA